MHQDMVDIAFADAPADRFGPQRRLGLGEPYEVVIFSEQKAHVLSDQEGERTAGHTPRGAQPAKRTPDERPRSVQEAGARTPLVSWIAALTPGDRRQGFALTIRSGAYSRCRSGWRAGPSTRSFPGSPSSLD